MDDVNNCNDLIWAIENENARIGWSHEESLH
jgi:hypothetical protein